MINMAVFVTYTILATGQPVPMDPFVTGITYQNMADCEAAKPEYQASFMKWSLEARNNPDPVISGTAKQLELSSIQLDCLNLNLKERAQK